MKKTFAFVLMTAAIAAANASFAQDQRAADSKPQVKMTPAAKVIKPAPAQQQQQVAPAAENKPAKREILKGGSRVNKNTPAAK
jgi:hypothetical protein